MPARKYHRRQAMASIDNKPPEGLAAKELRVLELIAEGKSNEDIAWLIYTERSTGMLMA